MQLSADYKRAFVTVLKAQADAQQRTFSQALIDCATGRINSTKTGRFLVAAAGNGRSVQYAMPAQAGGLNEVEVAELCGELMRRWDEARARLVAAGTATPTDAETYEELLGFLIPLTESTMDFSEVQ